MSANEAHALNPEEFFMIRSALMNVMTAAVVKAGRGLKRDFGEVENLQVSVKGPAISSPPPTSAPRKCCLRNCPRPAPATAS